MHLLNDGEALATRERLAAPSDPQPSRPGPSTDDPAGQSTPGGSPVDASPTAHSRHSGLSLHVFPHECIFPGPLTWCYAALGGLWGPDRRGRRDVGSVPVFALVGRL